MSVSIEGNPSDLRFRSVKDGPRGSIRCEGGPVVVKLDLPEKASNNVKFLVHCHAATEPGTGPEGRPIRLSSHTLHSQRTTQPRERFNPVSEEMSTKDGKNFTYKFTGYWIVAGTKTVRNASLKKYEQFYRKLGVPNITTSPDSENRSRLCLAFTVYKHDTIANKYIQIGSTLYSSYIYNCGKLRINTFFNVERERFVIGLSNNYHDYKLRIWHVNETNHNATCWEEKEIMALESEECIPGQRDRQMSLRKSYNWYIYNIPRFNCPVHGQTNGVYTLNVQVYFGQNQSDVLQYAYKHVLDINNNFH